MPPFVTGDTFRHRRPEDGKLYGLCHSTTEPTTVDVASVPRVVPACVAFSPEELDARIAYYADRAARGVPLFADGPPAVEVPNVVRCMGCDDPAPSGRHVAFAGWVSLPTRAGIVGRDVYCPHCHALLFGEDADDAA